MCEPYVEVRNRFGVRLRLPAKLGAWRVDRCRGPDKSGRLALSGLIGPQEQGEEGEHASDDQDGEYGGGYEALFHRILRFVSVQGLISAAARPRDVDVAAAFAHGPHDGSAVAAHGDRERVEVGDRERCAAARARAAVASFDHVLVARRSDCSVSALCYLTIMSDMRTW